MQDARKEFLIPKLTLYIVALFLLGACTRTRGTPQDALVVAIGSEPATLDPMLATDAYGMRMTSLLFASLVRLGPELKAVPYAAESWSHQGHQYDFVLRPLRFSDGRAVTPEDIEYSFQKFLKPGGVFSSMLDEIKAVHAREVAGQIHVYIEVRKLSDRFLTTDLPVIKILPAKGDGVSSGPFQLAHEDANEIEFKRVSGEGTPRLIFKVIRDDFTRYQKTLKGEVDIAQMEISPLKFHEFQAPQFQVFNYPGLTMTYILLNFRDPQLRQLKVRQALFAALNRDEIIRYKMHGLAEPATSILTPNNPDFNSDLTAVFKKANLNGLHLTLKTSNSPDAIDNGKVLAHQLASTGAKVELQSYEWGTFYNDVKTGNFQMATMRWVGTVDAGIYRLAFHSREFPPGRNRGFYSNPELDHVLDLADQSESAPERRKLFLRAQKMVFEDLTILPLWYDRQNAVASVKVINYHPNQTGDYWPLVGASKIHDGKSAEDSLPR